jgi:hypothetical protein
VAFAARHDATRFSGAEECAAKPGARVDVYYENEGTYVVVGALEDLRHADRRMSRHSATVTPVWSENNHNA